MAAHRPGTGCGAGHADQGWPTGERIGIIEGVTSCYTLRQAVPLDAALDNVQAARFRAVHQWFTDVAGRGMTPLESPDTELVDEAVVRVDGHVSIAQSWQVWGKVRRDHRDALDANRVGRWIS